jgi:hypothetical protein
MRTKSWCREHGNWYVLFRRCHENRKTSTNGRRLGWWEVVEGVEEEFSGLTWGVWLRADGVLIESFDGVSGGVMAGCFSFVGLSTPCVAAS